jgi:hypothetical protein
LLPWLLSSGSMLAGVPARSMLTATKPDTSTPAISLAG